jgi:hypothetical protein
MAAAVLADRGRLSGEAAAVDTELGAGNVGSLVRGEEGR